VLFGGSAGPGKSYALLMDALIFALEHPGATAILMRRTFPELEGSLIKESLRSFPAEIGRYNDAKHRWTIDCGKGVPHSYIVFGHCEREKDVYRHRSAEYQYLGIDESTSFSKEIFDELYGRVRSTIPGLKCRVRMCSNPGNIGHGWHKEFFGIGKGETPPGVVWKPEMKQGDKYPPPTRCFIPATVFDNPAIIEHDPGYLARLEGLTEAKKRMLLYGEWGGYSGQFFTELDRQKHQIKPFDIPKNWKLFRSVDFGFQKPFSCHWHAISENGHCYTYREAYQPGLRDRQQAKLIKDLSRDEAYEFTVGDPSMVVGSKDTGITTQQVYQEEGVIIFPGSNQRVPGWNAMRNWLSIDPATGTPWWQIFDNCPELFRELEECLHDDDKPEDVDTECSDHAIDECRYFFMGRPSPSKPLQLDDPRAKLDESSRQEWDKVAKIQRDAARGADANARAILSGLNEEGTW